MGTKETSMNVETTVLGTIELAGVKARLVRDHAGRRCISMPIADMEDVLFPVSHALIIRELLDLGIKAMGRYTEEPPSSPPQETP